MVELISNYTAAIGGLLLAFAYKDKAWGFMLATVVIAIWGQIWGIGSVPPQNFLGIWTWSIVAYSVVGEIVAWRLKTIPKLDPRWGKQIINTGSYAPLRIALKYVVFLAVVALVHIIFELDITGFPAPWGGFVSAAALIIPYGLLWLMFRREYDYYHYFEEYELLDKKEVKKRVENHVRDFVLWLGMIHIVTAIVFTIVDWIVADPSNYWNLFSLIIVAVVASIAILVVTSDRIF